MLRRSAALLLARRGLPRGLVTMTTTPLPGTPPFLPATAAWGRPTPSSIPTTTTTTTTRPFSSGGACCPDPSSPTPCPSGSLSATLCAAAEAGTPLDPATLAAASPDDLVAAAIALNSCARPPPRATYAAVADALAAVADRLSPRQLAAAASAFADAGHLAPALRDAVADQVTARTAEFDARTLARTVRAYGALSLHDEGMLDAVADRLASDLASFSATDLAAIADAAARVGYHSPTLLDAFSAAGATLAESRDGATLAALADALRRVGALDPALADRAAALFEADPHGAFDPASLATLLYALTAGGAGDEALLRAAAPIAAARLGDMKSKDLVRLARAYGWAGVHEAALFEALEAEVAGRVAGDKAGGFAVGGLVDVLDSFNRVAFTAPSLAVLAPMPAGLRPACVRES